ncbi:unnamed protein product [Microthlaspi erraticum]|uniref:Uncharacterized protein n=1 Tax=Microthlaspi erraticum TaxID=1685480 RepID=A0A6D2HEN9_9BRAS|nr:unnamed protein product [Microthlaspi erraticum]
MKNLNALARFMSGFILTRDALDRREKGSTKIRAKPNLHSKSFSRNKSLTSTTCGDSEDCTSLMKTRLSLGKFLPDLSWLVVASIMKNIVFHIRTVQTKIVYKIVTDEEGSSSSSSLSSMNTTEEDGVSLSIVVQFNPVGRGFSRS